MIEKPQKIGIIGAGAWGTALAIRLAQRHEVILWAHEEDTVKNIARYRENLIFLPGAAIPDAVQPVGDLADLKPCSIVFFVPPAQFLRSIAQAAAKAFMADPLIAIICSKGIESRPEGPALMSSILAETLPQARIAILSGPSFASEAAQNLPIALTLAAEPKLAQTLIEAFTMPLFRLYPSNDIIGAQIGGAVKNVLAIACGIAEGRKLGQNARAALIARGLAEMFALGQKLGAQRETLMGLSGIGDIVLTCTSSTSRNTSLGVALGEGKSLDDILRSRHAVSEGVHTAASLRALAEKNGLAMPICFAIHDILSGHSDIDTAIHQLLARDIPNVEIDMN